MIEQWKTAIVNSKPWENYKVSNLGRILSLNYKNTGRAELMNPFERPDGYSEVQLSKNKERKNCYVHRLVAETFLENPENKPCINHKIQGKKGKKINMVFFNEDGTIDKKRTTIEWVTYKENNDYGTHNERMAKTKSKKVLQFSLTGELIKEWESTNECGRNGFDQGHVAACCRGELKTHKGFRWMYAEDYREQQFKELGNLPLW